jgi:hypothetical protein
MQVVMMALRIPIRRPIISTIGVMQLVVQLAHEMISASGSAAFTPCTTVLMPSFSGAEKMARLAPAWMCFARSSLLVNAPVHSNTRSTASSRQGRLAGSLSLKTL